MDAMSARESEALRRADVLAEALDQQTVQTAQAQLDRDQVRGQGSMLFRRYEHATSSQSNTLG